MVPLPTWTKPNLTYLACDANTIHGCAYDFFISQNDNSPDFNCKIYDRQSSPENPAKQSFYGVSCNVPFTPDGGWVISVRSASLPSPYPCVENGADELDIVGV